MQIEFSFDDGQMLDYKTALMLEERGFRATFFIPVNRSELMVSDMMKLMERGHTIGAHTLSHPSDLKLLSQEDLEEEIIIGKKVLEEMVGRPVDQFCYPRGRYNEDVVNVVKRAGFKSARTTEVGVHLASIDRFRLPTTAHVFQRKEYNGLSPFEYLIDQVNKADHSIMSAPAVIHVWGHSNEIEREGLWIEFAKMLDLLVEVA